MRLFRLSVLILAVGLAALCSGCAPRVDFVATPDEGAAPLEVDFNDETVTIIPFLGDASAYIGVRERIWDFGDGVISEQKNPTHTYRTQGEYTVSLTVTTRFGTDTETKTDTIKVTGSASGVTAAFTATPVNGVAPLAVQFTNTSTVGDATVSAFEWNFGDGATATTENPAHTYTTPGVYNVTLTIRTSLGTSTITKQNFIEVAEEPRGPQAAFKESRTQGTAPVAVQFADLSSAGDSPITRWDWDFGDGGTSTNRNPLHTYSAAGTYSVSLTVTTALGTSIRRKPDLIRVLPAPEG